MSINVQAFRQKIRNRLQVCRVWLEKWRTDLLVQIVILSLIYICIWLVNFDFGWFSFPDLSPKIRIKNDEINYQDLLTYKLNYRDVHFKALSGLAVIIGLLIAYHRLRTANEEQMTNRFAKAVELLANDDTSVRLGALYALERIAKDSPKDYATIIETIAAYVRSRAPWPPKPKEKPENAKTQEAGPSPAPETGEETENTGLRPPKVKEDISAAIHILGRRKKVDHPEIFLNDTDLSGLTLTAKCNFSNANFQNARLINANLRQAILAGADLNWAILYRTDFEMVNLERSILYVSNLAGANLAEANLAGANLVGTGLVGANLPGASLYQANLERANLKGASLYKANLEGVKLLGANLEGAKHLTWKQLDYAQHAPHVYLAGADLPDYLLENPPDWYRPLMEQETAEVR